MKAFEWMNATTVADAVTALTSAPAAADPDDAARPIAGGQDLLTTMKEYITRPARVVNLKSIRGLDKIESDGKGALRIGALVTLNQLEEDANVRKNFPGLSEAAHSIGTPQIRNLGTVGGNLCQRPRCWYFRLEEVVCLKKGGSECYAATGENKYHAIFGGGPSYIVHPSDLAPMLVALGASVAVAAARGTRIISLDKFFTLPADANVRRENVLTNDEIITHVMVPASKFAAHSTYLKFKERDSMDFAMSAVAAAISISANKTVSEARIALGGVAPIPWRVPKAESVLIGKPLTTDQLTNAAKIAVQGAEPLAKNAYKIPLTQTLVRRALAKLGGVPATVNSDYLWSSS
ncbi:MAG TPA: xanthine dehydrogenase family protein subunit M [Pyrinomonadaceae bacterium]|jgi:xanthine dehydrogenase YagS FAD-binding subunit|nr:xanthine dehydrogenase family protein subunit M [Pyrinomonadaceae bacterium]